jgi:hypothetical protein
VNEIRLQDPAEAPLPVLKTYAKVQLRRGPPMMRSPVTRLFYSSRYVDA